jgi:tape measure domain-containing protein
MNNANGGNILFHFKGDSSQLKNTVSSLGGMTKSILAATGITKAFSMAWNMVSSSTGDAIDRFDQLKAFPRVMQSLGISAEDSEKAVNDLADGLKGLPTTLNAGTTAVSRFTAKNGDVQRSTKMFLALNDAIIAGNAPLENQQAALEQMMQSYSKGKPDMMEWRSLMTAMPGQLKQVAKAMGYVNTDELYNALFLKIALLLEMLLIGRNDLLHLQ